MIFEVTDMLETYSFSHSGGLEEYLDKVYVSYGQKTYAYVINGRNDKDSCTRIKKAVKDVFIHNINTSSFKNVSEEIRRNVKSNDEYLLLEIDDNSVVSEIHGGLKGYLIRNGSIVSVTNGLINLKNEDRLIFGTDRFFRDLSLEMILIDALTSLSAEEWMGFLICRKSEFNMLKGENLSAITVIVRNNEDVRLV